MPSPRVAPHNAETAPPNVRIAALAARRHGLVTTVQLRQLGLDRSAVARRVARGWLHPVHPGVYAVGHPALTLHGRLLAAVLACGPTAVLSHRSAAALWGLLRWAPPQVETTTTVRRRGPRGVRVHESGTLTSTDLTERLAIPLTSVPRTLLDLAEVVRPDVLERAIHEAEYLRLFDLRAVDAVLARANGRRGVAALRAALTAYRPRNVTRTELEDRFLALCAAAGLPRPEVNVHVQAGDGPLVEVDFLWRTERLCVETDGGAAHRTTRGFEHDRRRDARLQLAGWRPVRFTYRRVCDAPAETVATVGGLLRLGAPVR